MKEFKLDVNGIAIPIVNCETQIEFTKAVSSFRYSGGKLGVEAHEDEYVCNIYIIYKDGTCYYHNGVDKDEGKYKRTGIKSGIITDDNSAIVFGSFAINEYGNISIDESDIEEYGVYAGQYDVKEQDEQEAVEQTEVEETAENAMESAEVKTNSELHLDEEIVKAFEKQKSSFKFYGVDMAYQVERYVNCGSLKYVQLGTYSDYSKAVQAAYEAIKEWGEENIYFHTVEIAKRNSKTAKDKYDREILKSEKKEIGYYWYASRLTDSKECVHISIDSPIKIPIETTQKSEIKEVKETVETETDDSGFEYTTSQAQEIIMTGTSIAREKYREKHNIHSPMDLKKFSKKQLDDYLSKELDYINKFLNDTIPKEVFNAMKGEIMYA